MVRCTTATTIVLLVAAVVLGQECRAGTAQRIAGNWYCSEVKAITYSNFPGTGSHNKVTRMDINTGRCTTKEHGYSGSLAPMNEEVGYRVLWILTKADRVRLKLSMHFRGPTWLKQVAVYYPGVDSDSLHNPHTKRTAAGSLHGHGHSHHAHQRLHRAKHLNMSEAPLVEKRALGDIVAATIDGQLVHWVNQYAGTLATSSTPSPHQASEVASACPYCSVETTVTTYILATGNQSTTPPGTPSVYPITEIEASTSVFVSGLPFNPSPSSVTSSVAPKLVNPLPVGGTGDLKHGSWSRQAYYNADAGSLDGFTFLNHFGGTSGMPGTADGGPAFGASLSYASSDGKSAAASSQVLHNQLIEDDVEVIVLSNKTCDGGSCGYTRPGGVAYHGFAGDHKLFLMEFSMPATGKTGFNADMPGIWLLNAQIPLTSQYGTNSNCSCWTSGCGEFDLFEVLDTGDFRCKSTLHMAPAGGSSDYFQRPENHTIKAAVLFMGSNQSMRIQILDDDQMFGESLAAEVVDAMAQDDSKSKSSVFRLARADERPSGVERQRRRNRGAGASALLAKRARSLGWQVRNNPQDISLVMQHSHSRLATFASHIEGVQ